MRNTLRLLVLALALSTLSSGRMTAQQGIPNPDAYFGFKIGADGELARYPKILEYFQLLAKQTDRFTGADLEDVVRRAGMIAIRVRGAEVAEVTKADFDAAMDDSRATVTEAMEEEYKKMRGELKKRAMEVQPIGFIYEGMVESTRDKKHT